MERRQRAWRYAIERAAETGEWPVTVARACAVAVPVLGVDGFGVTLVVGPRLREMAGTSGPVGTLVEESQLTVGEGPCTDAYTTLEPVQVPDVEAARDRWPGWVPMVAGRDVGAVFAFPLQVAGVRIGVVDFYRATPEPLGEDRFAEAVAFADVAAGVAFRGHPAPGTLTGLDGTEPPHGFPRVVHQACGMLAAILEVGVDEACARLRAYAYLHEQPLTDLAGQVVSRTFPLKTASSPAPPLTPAPPTPPARAAKHLARTGAKRTTRHERRERRGRCGRSEWRRRRGRAARTTRAMRAARDGAGGEEWRGASGGGGADGASDAGRGMARTVRSDAAQAARPARCGASDAERRGAGGAEQRGAARRGAARCGAVRRGAARCGAVRRGAARCGTARRGDGRVAGRGDGRVVQAGRAARRERANDARSAWTARHGAARGGADGVGWVLSLGSAVGVVWGVDQVAGVEGAGHDAVGDVGEAAVVAAGVVA
ncbi:GAF and ANTAR domain-containing protein [Actinomadura sp. J1-007]|uniref:GAF and ANTAR domain-containing protein n=1 Tax=Actinomadura sp. J1-007 TaxID=2661913 RepID=UPI00136B6AC4|nr:GAF and ANTAR domain-containing protein [Actinomadura sp. J1-007]